METKERAGFSSPFHKGDVGSEEEGIVVCADQTVSGGKCLASSLQALTETLSRADAEGISVDFEHGDAVC